jgi:hypothetical protein
VSADLGTGVGRAAVQPHPGTAGRPVGGDLAGVGAEVVLRILGGDPALQGGTDRMDGALVGKTEIGQRLTARDAHLRLHEVDAGDLLGDRVLDLDARIHLDEAVTSVVTQQELDGAGARVADLLGEPDGVGADLLTQRVVEMWGGRDLHDLLMSPLH